MCSIVDRRGWQFPFRGGIDRSRSGRARRLAERESRGSEHLVSGDGFRRRLLAPAPVRQLVITGGTLDFQTREGKHFALHPGDILLAEDTAGSGHSWRLTDGAPWRRTYVVLQPGTEVPFRALTSGERRTDER